MPELNLTEENLLSRAGVSDRTFADHSGAVQNGYELGSLTRGLVAYYPMDEGQGQVLHDGVAGNLGQINGASWTAGTIGDNSLDFDGTSAYVDCSSQLLEDSSLAEFTFSVWINPDTVSNSNIVGRQDGGDTNFEGRYLRLKDDGEISIQIRDDTGTNLVKYSSSTVSSNSWYHIVATYDGSKAPSGFNIYIDGVNAGSSNTTDGGVNDTIGGTENFSIGARDPDGSTSSYVDGQIDDVRIYDRALSQPEIEALYNLTQPSGSLVEERDLPTYPDDEVVARYEFEGDVTDSWGDNDGTDNTSAGYVDGVYGQAKDFDGSNDYVAVSDDPSLYNTEFTVSHWIKLDDSSNTVTYLPKWYTNSGEREWRFVYNSSNNDNNQAFQWVTYSGSEQSIQQFENVVSGSWYNVVGTYRDYDKIRLYVNGELVSEDLLSYAIQNGPADIEIGGSTTYSEFLDGSIDDLRIYSRALEPQEVERLYNKGAYRINRGEI
jgi:hypothetical protein